jgi:two-component system, cell cycle sensor histidine kinase and response regulator CckA
LADTLSNNYRRCLQAGTTISYEESFRTKTGERCFYTALAPLKDDTGQIFRIIGVAHDITKRKLAEKVMQESESKYRSLVNNIKLGVFRSTAKGKHLEVNKAMENITGYSRDELLTMNIADLYIHSEERQQILENLILIPDVKTYEIKNKRKDGRPIVVAATITPIVDSSENTVCFDGILEDITERKKTEEGRRLAAQEWRMTFDSISDSISIVDKISRLSG